MCSYLASFAQACFETSTIPELEDRLNRGPDPYVLAIWSLTEFEWEYAIKTAIESLKGESEDAS